ncbi:MAG: hypothetical protein CM15mV6_2220 [uncultured marine virus]|nr:MAG: hypothetical protein CM15mV6_2220 [uncultured marine virus]
MKSQFILFACFLPLAAIYIVMKFAVWMSAVNNETIYVSKERFRKRGPMWRIRMRTLMKRKRSMEIRQIINDVLHQYYVVERGMPIPRWKSNTDPQWWIDYLASLKDGSIQR